MHLTRHPAPMQALSHCQAVRPPARQKPKFSNNPSAKTRQIPSRGPEQATCVRGRRAVAGAGGVAGQARDGVPYHTPSSTHPT